MANSHSNSATAPAVALILGLLLLAAGNLLMALIGGLLILGGGVLLIVRLGAMAVGAGDKTEDQ